MFSVDTTTRLDRMLSVENTKRNPNQRNQEMNEARQQISRELKTQVEAIERRARLEEITWQEAGELIALERKIADRKMREWIGGAEQDTKHRAEMA